MRITHTPFSTPTRSIGRDATLTIALILELAKPKLTITQKIKQLFKL